MVWRQPVGVEKPLPLLFQVAVIQLVKELGEVADHDVAVPAFPDKPDGPPGKVDIVLPGQVCPVGHGGVGHPQPGAFLVVALVEDEVVKLEDAPVDVGGIARYPGASP